jgi:nucleoside-diphosphate-sugar epimerase
MRVLITGAAGFLGRAFAEHHAKIGNHVYGIDDNSNPNSFWPERIFQRIDGDAAEVLATMPRIVEHFDLAYHFAGDVGGRVVIEGDPLRNADSLRLDTAFFRWAVRHAGTVVYPSSSAVYGASLQNPDRGKVRPLWEALFDPADTASTWFVPDELYGFTKLAGEVLAWKSAGYGLNALCIRPFSGYGPDQGLDYPVPAIAARVARREDPLTIWGSGRQVRDFIYIDDLVAATEARLGAGVTGYQAMNIGSGEPILFREVAAILARIEGYQPHVVTDPDRPTGVAIRYADVTEMHRYYVARISLHDGLAAVLERRKAIEGVPV